MAKSRLCAKLRRLLKRNPRCFYCRVALDETTATLDHYIPRSKGGHNGRRNLVLACLPCNSDKADMMPGEFMSSPRLEIRRRGASARALKPVREFVRVVVERASPPLPERARPARETCPKHRPRTGAGCTAR